MYYAIVDIETTGGYAAANGITEIAIFIHDGKQVVRSYETLVNPGMKIPYYITGLTGITDDMVKNAPAFSEVAADVYGILQGTVFIAHSVNFDYSFIKNALAECGYDLNCKKLCTVRLSRKIVPGLKSYSLGNICAYLDIAVQNRHRATGDAAATVQLFEYLLAKDSANAIPLALKKNSKEQALPPNLAKEEFEALPGSPGVYYFHDRKGKIIYVGKAVNIKKRVSGHFSNNSGSRQKQNFMREVFHISCQLCNDEASAFALENQEIKRLWPKFNQAQKHYEPLFGIVHYTDQNGFMRLGMQKVKKRSQALVCFTNMIEGFNTLKEIAYDNELCPRLSGIITDKKICEDADCVCCSTSSKKIKKYNKKVAATLETLPALQQANLAPPTPVAGIFAAV